jgi:transposase
MSVSLTDDFIASLRLASKKLNGFPRREFQAEMRTKYCGGSARRAEAVFGWSRGSVTTGLNELRTGIRCVERFSRRGRRKTEDKVPNIKAEILKIVEPHAQADPKFQTTQAFTRITAKSVREQLRKNRTLRKFVPCRQTIGTLLNRMGYSLKRVQKTRPEKRFRKQTPSSTTSRRLVGAR